MGEPILKDCTVKTVGVHEDVAGDKDLRGNETESEDEVWANQIPDVTINELVVGFWTRARDTAIRSMV